MRRARLQIGAKGIQARNNSNALSLQNFLKLVSCESEPIVCVNRGIKHVGGGQASISYSQRRKLNFPYTKRCLFSLALHFTTTLVPLILLEFSVPV